MAYSNGRTYGARTPYHYLFGEGIYTDRQEEGTPPAPPDLNAWIDNLNNNIIDNNMARIVFNDPTQ
jgi:hypothetical protein